MLMYRYSFLLPPGVSILLLQSVRGDELTMAELLASVKLHEQIYADIDISWSYQYKSPVVKEAANVSQTDSVQGQMLKVSAQSFQVHVVTQGDCFRAERKGSIEVEDGSVATADRVRAFDGTKTRLIEQASYGNVIERRVEDECVLRPHMLLLYADNFNIPLSTFLSGTDAILSHPQSNWEPNYLLDVSSLGSEQIDGLTCDIVYVDTIIGGKPYNGWKLWLARDRNMIPARIESFTYRISKQSPVGLGIASEWREITEGVWFPFHSVRTSYNKDALRSGNIETQWLQTIDIASVSLVPNYPHNYFSNVTFPIGMPVYYLNLDKTIAKSEVISAPGGPESGATAGRRHWLLAVNAIGIVLLVVYFARGRWQARGQMPPGAE
jgi:hypothetical protein